MGKEKNTTKNWETNNNQVRKPPYGQIDHIDGVNTRQQSDRRRSMRRPDAR